MYGLKVLELLNFCKREGLTLPLNYTSTFYLDESKILHKNCLTSELKITNELNLTFGKLQEFKLCEKKRCIDIYQIFASEKELIITYQNLARIVINSRTLLANSSLNGIEYTKSVNFIDRFDLESNKIDGYDVKIKKFNSELRQLVLEDRDRYIANLCNDEVKSRINDEIVKYLLNSAEAPIKRLRQVLGYKNHDNTINIDTIASVINTLERLEPKEISQIEEIPFININEFEGKNFKEYANKFWREKVISIYNNLGKENYLYLNTLKLNEKSYVYLKNEISYYNDNITSVKSLQEKWISCVFVTDNLTANYLKLKFNAPVVSSSIKYSGVCSEALTDLVSVLIKEQEEINDLELALEKAYRLLC